MSFPHHYTPLHGRPRDPDRRSLRIAVAAELLRRGRTPAHVAETTGVPFALVEWLAEHTTRPAEHDHTRSPRPARRRIRVIVPFTVGWLLTCALSVISVVGRQPVVGAVTVALSTLLVVVSAVVVAAHRRGPQRPGPG